jgi:DNA repair exonuclease SbcCD ATPase subunit
MTPSRPATSRDVRRIAANLRADKEWSILPNRLESAADLIDALTARVAELEETIEAMNDPKSVGNPTWLAYQMEERAMKAEAENARLREALSELIEGIDRWNEAVAQIVDVSHLPKWQGLEAARTALEEQP